MAEETRHVKGLDERDTSSGGNRPGRGGKSPKLSCLSPSAELPEKFGPRLPGSAVQEFLEARLVDHEILPGLDLAIITTASFQLSMQAGPSKWAFTCFRQVFMS